MARVKFYDLRSNVQATVIKKVEENNEDDGDHILEIVYYVEDYKTDILGELKVVAGYETPEEQQEAYDKVDKVMMIETFNDLISNARIPIKLTPLMIYKDTYDSCCKGYTKQDCSRHQENFNGCNFCKIPVKR